MIDWKNTLVKCETTSDIVDVVRFLTKLGYYLRDETIDEFAESLCACYPSENMRLDFPYVGVDYDDAINAINAWRDIVDRKAISYTDFLCATTVQVAEPNLADFI